MPENATENELLLPDCPPVRVAGAVATEGELKDLHAMHALQTWVCYLQGRLVASKNAPKLY